jgi:NitT/TauT family transport system ATP-binding protein
MLEVRGISKSFGGGIQVLSDVNLAMAPGGFTSLLGPSGCGKTTLLRIVAGLIDPDEGEVIVAGEKSTGPSQEKTFVFQHFGLFPWRSVLDNAAYGLELQGVGKAERHEKARGLLKTLGLERFESYYPGQISGGMQQRVGLARALAVDPKLVLMDEPFGALDALTRERLQYELEAICVSRGLTVLFVTHSIDEALFLSDSVAVMGIAPGRIVELIDVKLPRPRSRADIRSDPSYAGMRAGIWSLLQAELTRTQIGVE